MTVLLLPPKESCSSNATKLGNLENGASFNMDSPVVKKDVCAYIKIAILWRYFLCKLHLPATTV